MSQAPSHDQPEADMQSPLESLASSLDADMRAVNAKIIEHMQSPVSIIPKLAGYLIAAGGKRIRPLLTLACTHLYEGDISRAHALAASVEFIHTATLLHDDVVDKSDERRGQKAANLVFGNQASVLVGDFLFSRAFQLMVSDGSLDVLRILSKASAIIAEGEVLQLTTARRLETSFDEYINVIEAKTAELFAAACAVGPVIAGKDKEQEQAMYDFGYNLGIAFQIVDDILDYDADQEKLGKTIGDDFMEGKITAPVIIALENADQDEKQFWQRTLQDQKYQDGDLEAARRLLKKHGALERSLEQAKSYAEKARNALKKSPEKTLRSLLEDTITYTIHRGF